MTQRRNDERLVLDALLRAARAACTLDRQHVRGAEADMLQNAPRKNALLCPKARLKLVNYVLARVVLSGTNVLGIPESLVTFIDGAGGALSFIEFRLPSECRVLDSLVGTLTAVGVQILHIQVQTKRGHVNHRLRVAECDGSDVSSPRRFEVQSALLGLVECALRNVRRPLAKSKPSKHAAGSADPNLGTARVP